MKGVDFFNSVEHLEPRCPKCETKIEWGITTEWDDEKDAQVCITCKTVLK